VLRHYLQHHAGEPAASFTLMAPTADGVDGIWARLARAMGMAEQRVGQPVRAGAGRAAFAGTLQAVDHVPQGHAAMVVVHEPAPGIVLASGMDCMGMQMACFQAFFYGPRAAAAAAAKDEWQQWLVGLFPPPPAPPGS
jgi:hypothetical protein